ncbi:MAG: hypothetical protein HYX79_07365 [Chloroflexi bacterium]|nr:hypothetical protein [Chloroflexota bacterium]
MFGRRTQGEEKLPGPKDVPELVGRYMVLQLKKDPDWVWKAVKGVVRPVAGKKKAFYCRCFEESNAIQVGLKVKDWTSLDTHPELIIWEGFFDKDTLEVRTEKLPAQ